MINSIDLLQQAFVSHVKAVMPTAAQMPADFFKLHLNVDEARQGFGNLSTNVAMVLAKELKTSPRTIAQDIARFSHELVEKVEIAGPGFINIYLTQSAFECIAVELFEQKEVFFKSLQLSVVHNYSLEFVSANPTGPLHFGHGRGGILGDVLCNVLRFVGHTVSKEFYINDAGNQMNKLGESLHIRCLQAAGKQVTMPEDGYQGEYLIALARDLYEEYGDVLFDKTADFFIEHGKNKMLCMLQATLSSYGIEYDVWFSEKTLHQSNAIPKALDILEQKEMLYTHEDALWFKTTLFGDDKDRVVKKASGEYTYIAADIAYLYNKIQRGFDHLVMVLGHDHHSYVTRLNAVKNGLGYETIPLDVILYQLVKMSENGELVRMSKRSGAIITLQDIIDTVGKDVARFFYLHRKADAQLEFDIELALKKTDENPVYYVQYAYVRTGSIKEKAHVNNELAGISSHDAAHIGPEETLLLKKMLFLRELLHDISNNHQIHLLTYYSLELAQLFHKYYSHVRVIDMQDVPKTRARLLMIELIRSTLKIVFNLMGISAPDKM